MKNPASLVVVEEKNLVKDSVVGMVRAMIEEFNCNH
jgi:Cdc6-like AAA superfamily ATPase